MMRAYSKQSLILFHCNSAVSPINIYGPLTSASHGLAFARIQIANYLCKGNYTASSPSTKQLLYVQKQLLWF